VITERLPPSYALLANSIAIYMYAFRNNKRRILTATLKRKYNINYRVLTAEYDVGTSTFSMTNTNGLQLTMNPIKKT